MYSMQKVYVASAAMGDSWEECNKQRYIPQPPYNQCRVLYNCLYQKYLILEHQKSIRGKNCLDQHIFTQDQQKTITTTAYCHVQWSLCCKTAPSAGLRRSLVGVRSHIGVQFVLKILLGAEGGRSHMTSRSYNRGSYNAGTTVCIIEVSRMHMSQTYIHKLTQCE